MSEHNNSGRGPNFGAGPAPQPSQRNPIPQFDDATKPHVDLDSTLDIQPNEPIQDLLNEETLNLGPSRSIRRNSTPATPPPKQDPFHSSLGPDEPSATVTTEAPPSAYMASSPSLSPSTQDVEAFPSQNSLPQIKTDPPPTSGKKDGDKIPWWAFWKKLKQVQKRRKQMSQTGELPAFNWDVKTMPASALPPKQPPVSSSPKPATNEEKKAKPPAQPRKTNSPAWLQGVWLALWLGLTVAYSVPLWVTSSFPITQAPAQVGLLHHVAQTEVTQKPLFQSESLALGGKMGEWILSFWTRLLPENIALSLWLQLSLLFTVLALGWLLHIAKRPHWNLLLAFPLLYSYALLATDLTFFLALPLILLGLGSLYAWLVNNHSMHGLVVLVMTWLLLYIHPEAYMLFFIATVVGCLLLARTWSERLVNLALPGSSLLAFLPWVYVMLQRFSPGAKQGVMTANLKQRMLTAWSSLTLPTQDGWGELAALVLLGVLWLGVSFATSFSNPKENDGRRLFFPVLALVMLLVFFLVPERWAGFTFATTSPLVIASFLVVGWISVSPDTSLGKILLLVGVLLSSSYGYHMIRSYRSYHDESSRLQTILQRLPKKKRLLVWSPPGSRVFRSGYHQAGGYYMIYRQGVSNIDLKGQLKWGSYRYASRRALPSPHRWRTPNLAHWDYVLTGRTPPNHWQPHLRLTLRSGPFRIYRKVQPKPTPQRRNAPTPSNDDDDDDE